MKTKVLYLLCISILVGIKVSNANFVQEKRISDLFNEFVKCVQETKKPYRCTGAYVKFANEANDANTSFAKQKLNQTEAFLKDAARILESRVEENESVEDRKNLIKLLGMIEISSVETTERDRILTLKKEISAILAVQEKERLEAELRSRFSRAKDKVNDCFDKSDASFCGDPLRDAQQRLSALADEFPKAEISKELKGLELVFARAKNRAESSLQIIERIGSLEKKTDAAKTAQDLLFVLAEYDILEYDQQLAEKIDTLESEAAKTLKLLQKAEYARQKIENDKVTSEIVESLREIVRGTQQRNDTQMRAALVKEIQAIDQLIASRLKSGLEMIEDFLRAISTPRDVEEYIITSDLIPSLNLLEKSCRSLKTDIFLEDSSSCENFLISANTGVQDQFKGAVSSIDEQLEKTLSFFNKGKNTEKLSTAEINLNEKITTFDDLASLCSDLFSGNLDYYPFDCVRAIQTIAYDFDRKKSFAINKLLFGTFESWTDRSGLQDRDIKFLSERVRLASALENKNLTVIEKGGLKKEEQEFAKVDLPQLSKAVEKAVTSGLVFLEKFKKQIENFKFNRDFQSNVPIERYRKQIEGLKLTLMFVDQLRIESGSLYNALVVEGPPILQEPNRLVSLIEDSRRAEKTVVSILQISKFANALREGRKINDSEVPSSEAVDDLGVLVGAQRFDADAYGLFIFKQIEKDFELGSSAFGEKYGKSLSKVNQLFRKSPTFLEAFSGNFLEIYPQNSVRRGKHVFLQELDLTWFPVENSQEIFRGLIANGFPVSEIFRILEQFDFKIGGILENPSEMLKIMADYSPVNEDRLPELIKDARNSGEVHFKGFYPKMGFESVAELLNIYLPNCIAAASFDGEIKVRPLEYIIREDVDSLSGDYELISYISYIGYESNVLNVVASSAFEPVRKLSILEGWVPIDCESIERGSDNAIGWNGNAARVSGSSKHGLEKLVLNESAIDRIWGVEDLSSEGFAEAFYQNYLDDGFRNASTRVRIEDEEPFGRFILFEDLDAGVQLKLFETRKEIILKVIRGAQNVDFN